MIGVLPVSDLARPGLRYALDAALALLASTPGAPLVRCGCPDLAAEVRQRLPVQAPAMPAPAALWVEPAATDWQAELASLAAALAPGATLVIVASRPLARRLPERGRAVAPLRSASRATAPAAAPLGLRIGGIDRLRRACTRAGFRIAAVYGIHSALAIGLNLLGLLAERLGRPDLGDRLHVAARLRYCTAGPLAPVATVALIIARKEPH